jgi:chitosanase
MIELQARKAILNILTTFETGKILSAEAYSTISILHDRKTGMSDGAGFSGGSHQATDRAGSFDQIVLRYIDARGRYASEFVPFLARLAINESTKLDPANLPQWALDLMAVFRKAGADPVMQQVQDRVFEEMYLNPAYSQCGAMGLIEPLSYLVVADTCVQSGPGGVGTIRMRFAEKPPIRGGAERAWTQAYVRARRAWLAAYPNPLVQRSVYRMDAVQKLIDEKNWSLSAPLVVRGQICAA